jgi:hypothetical protein
VLGLELILWLGLELGLWLALLLGLWLILAEGLAEGLERISRLTAIVSATQVPEVQSVQDAGFSVPAAEISLVAEARV